MRQPTDDDFVGMAPCVLCESFPQAEPWYASFNDPNVLIHLGRDAKWHKITRRKFNLMRPGVYVPPTPPPQEQR